MKPWLPCRKRQKHRLAESRAAIERQERLGDVIDWHRAEAAEVASWARERLHVNHLTELFLTTRGSRR